MIKKWLYLPVIVCTLLILVGCFEIEEKIHLNRDGSGHYSINLDVTSFTQLMETYGDMWLDSMPEENMGMPNDFNEQINMLRAIQGVSNVNSFFDPDNNLYGYNYDFESLAVVEHVRSTIGTSGAVDFSDVGDSLSFRNRKFQREQPMFKDSLTDEEMESMYFYFQDLKYSVEYSFDQKIKSIDPSYYSIGEDKKSAFYTFSIDDLLGSDRKDFSVAIKLRRSWW